MTAIYDRLHALGIVLPKAPTPTANYRAYRISGALLFLAGHGPVEADGFLHTGMVGRDVSQEDAYARARLVGINLLASAHAALGDLSRVRQVVKLLGFVYAAPDFLNTPEVINGCSDLFAQVFGEEIACAARSAVGVASLPYGQSIEIEGVLEFE